MWMLEQAFCAKRMVSKADRKSTRLNSSHLVISYAVFCLKKKKKHDEHLTYNELCTPDRAREWRDSGPRRRRGYKMITSARVVGHILSELHTSDQLSVVE